MNTTYQMDEILRPVEEVLNAEGEYISYTTIVNTYLTARNIALHQEENRFQTMSTNMAMFPQTKATKGHWNPKKPHRYYYKTDTYKKELNDIIKERFIPIDKGELERKYYDLKEAARRLGHWDLNYPNRGHVIDAINDALETRVDPLIIRTKNEEVYLNPARRGRRLFVKYVWPKEIVDKAAKILRENAAKDSTVRKKYKCFYVDP